MNSERNPHLLNDPSGGGGCIIGSTSVPPTGGPIHGYGSPPGSHGGGGCGDMGVGPPCPVPTPPWVKPPSNHSNSGMMTPESDVSSCSSPASTSYGASSQQQHLQQRAFYGSTTNYSNNCATGGNNSGGGGGNDLSSTGGVVHTTMNQIRSGGTYNNSNAISSSTNSSGMFYDASGEVIDQSQYYHHSHHQTQHFQHQQFSTSSPNNMHLHPQQHKTGSNCSTPSLENNANLTGECSGGGGGGDSVASSGGGGNFYGFYNTNQSGQYTDYHQHHEQHHSDLHQHHDTSTGVYPGSDHTNANGNRMHQYYRQDGSSVSANSVPVGHGYFNSSAPNSNYPTSSGTSTPPTRYGSPMVFPNNHTNYGQQQQLQTHHHHLHHQNLQGGQMPPRRNSIESFSSEPGDMHNSYSARFPCGNAPVNNMSHNNHNHPHQGNMPQMATHHHQNSFPAGSAGPVENVIKRECGSISNRGSPVMNQMNSMNSTGCWSPQQGGGGYFPSTSPNNDCTSSSSPNNICSNESATNSVNNVNRTNFMHHNNTYNQNICGGGSGESGNCASTGFYPPQQNQHHQPPTPTQFKSCAYEQSQQHHDIKEGIPSMVANAIVGNNLKAGSAVKHRSLSLSMPLPSYLENNGSSRPDLDNNFVNNHRQQLSHHEQLHGSNNHNQPFSSMVDTSSQHLQHHHHSHCTTSGLVPPPEQNLLTPNSDDDIPFRAASAGGQSDLDSSYETMGEEGCSSTSTSVASHCMNTSGNSTCSGGGGDNSAAVSTMAIATTTEHLHSISVNNTTTMQQDCQHHHHHHHHSHVSSADNLAFSSSTSISSCMQSQHHHHHLHQHHHVASSMNIGMLELPNSTVALCTTNVDDLDESSSDSSVELHNVISAVVENSSIETPENTMMGDDDEVDNVVEGMMVGDGIPTESCFHHHQDNQADVNVISTTTNEPEEMDDDDDDDDDVGGDHDHNVDDNCSESSMSHINSSFTADMFCDGNSNQDSNGLIIATSNALSPNSNDNNAEDTNMINSSSGNNDFSCISEEANFIGNEVEHIEEDNNGNANTNESLQVVKSVPSSPSGTDSTCISMPSPSSSSVTPKATKRSFSEAEKDYRKIGDVGKAMSTTSSSSSTSSMTTATLADTKPSSLTTTFGATLRKACRGESVVRSGGDDGSSATASTTSQQSVKNDDFNSPKNNNKEDNNGSENSGKNNVNSVRKEENSSCGGSTNNNSKSSNATTSCGGVSVSNTSTSVTTASSSCKAIDIIISSSVNNVITTSCGNNNDNNNRVSIPKGWKREILKGTTNDNGNPNGTTGVLYISPSDTKIRNLDELKNYIGSDGTCKCGLSCPLRLEIAFSFDPKVTNMTAEDEKENLASLHAASVTGGSTNGGGRNGSSASTSTSSSSSSSTSSSSSSSSNAVAGVESDTRLLCNHKRKIPKAEDSPLISSTRDDLGDFGEKLKKRRLSGNECLGDKLVSSGPFRKDPISTSSPTKAKCTGGGSSNNGSSTGSKKNVGHSVPVPFCQQSPDTTTQTPQTEMSPASSVCSDGSTILFSSSTSGNSNSGGNRSLTSTPTPTSSSSSTSSVSSVSTPAAATTSKIGSSPSQGQGPNDQFVWPSPPITLHQTGSNLSSSTTNIPQTILPQLSPISNPANGTFWLSPANSLATLSTGPFVSSGSNSLTLNYVQSPNNINSVNCVSSGNIISSIGAISLASTIPNTLVTTSSTTAATSVPTSTTTATVTATTGGTSATKKPYQLFQKNVRRPSSPCPNIDVRQLPLEQNRPPPITPSPVLPTSTSIISSKLSPLAPTTPSNISATISNAATTTITSLPTLPVVTNPNILFTVAPPLVATNKTEIVSLSTPTLPILPLLTTSGKLPTVGSIDTTCGAPTIVTTLQPNANIFGTIDANTLFPAGNQNKQNPAVLSISSKPTIVQQSSAVKADSNSTGVSSDTKKNDENSKTDKETNNSGKSQGKDGKDNKTTKDGDKCPLQLAQDILNRFEKKSGDKNAETGSSKSNGGNNNNNENVGNAKKINSTTPFPKAGGEEKAREKGSSTTKTSKSTKDGNKTEDKSNKNEVATAAVAKIDSSTLSSSSNSELTTTTKAAEMGSTKHNETGANKNSSGVTTESKLGRATSSTADIVILHQSTDDKSKLPIDSSKHTINLMSSILPATSINATVSLNSIVCSTNSVTTQLPQLAENTIITSQTPVMSTTPLILKDGLQLATEQGLTLTTSVSGSIPTISLSAMGNQIIQTSCAPVPCSNTLTAGGLGTFGTATTNQPQFILQPSHATSDHANGANQTFITTSTGPGAGQLRYPFFQSIQPLFLNQGHAGGPLIISQPTQPSQDHTQGNPTITQQSFIYDQNGTPTATIDATGAFQSMLQPTTTMVLDPSICAGNANMAGGKKKKKRLSKKQQQQQAQLQLQQQFILQQIQAQQQQAAAAAIAPLTIFPQSFNLGPQGFSLQPTMNFFQTPTILTLPNLILNPADGTLFIQPSQPLPTATTQPMQPTTMKLGQFPLTTTTQMTQNPQNIAPKKDGTGTTIIQNLMEPLKPSTTPGLDPGSDDSRQNPTPDSSTNDLQLGLINVATGPTQATNTITLNIPAQTTTTVLHNTSPVLNKKNSKSRTVSSSSTTMKRILPQKQILPKIDSTTPSTTENAN